MDDVYREWFDSKTVSVTVNLQNSDDFLTPIEIAELTGAPKESTILVTRDDKVISFRVSNKIFSEDMFRYLVADSSGISYYIKNVVLALKEEYTKNGIGPRCVIKEIYAAAKLLDELPIKAIKVSAVGDFESFRWKTDPMRGYYVWARMGFDGKIPAAVRQKLSLKYRNLEFISSLMLDIEARKEWLEKGESVELEFDLASGSVSWRLLSQYMNEKGIEL
ncbi:MULTISPECIES: hypothetical protein [unclassified Duganella]|uniref:hypothetical protein n=1 Tax=unclassified Duganella TaxID=2636909 RepID=UPI0011C18465|nr:MULTISPECIES: hypothetical protein [unclassified Duganella]